MIQTLIKIIKVVFFFFSPQLQKARKMATGAWLLNTTHKRMVHWHEWD